MASQEGIHKSPSSPIIVVIVPFTAQSHLNQLLQLSHIISSFNIQVHYVSSSLHISQVKSRSANIPNQNIIFHGLPTPDFPSPPPQNTSFPSHQIPSFKASLALRDPVESLLVSLSKDARRLIVIHDPLMSCVVDQHACVVSRAESYVFGCVSATFSAALMEPTKKIMIGDVTLDVLSQDSVDAEFIDFVARQLKCLEAKKVFGYVRNTSRVIESEFIKFLEEKEREAYEEIKHWYIGPLETVTEFKNKAISNGSDHRCLEWLNKQEENSVLYVSFGTTTFMEDEQIREIATGLEESGAKFIWVLREVDKGNIFDEVEDRKLELPMGFEERMERLGMGIVVREWAPQLKILGHPSTGGFMSHCGWNSVLESLSLGVPIATWPVHSDQPVNAVLVTSVFKVGVVVRDWEKKDELVSSSKIAKAVKRLMKSEEGDMIKKRAEDLGYELRKSNEKGGVSRSELESFVAHITRS